jgi:hypothetical protein
MITEDVPAAHSMDTEWFAVDADGHVGHFVTGEDATFPDEGWPAGGGATAATAEAVHEYAFEHGWIGADAEVVARARVPSLEHPGQHVWFEEQRALPGRYAAMYEAMRAKWLAKPWWQRLLRRRQRPQLFDPGARNGTLVMDVGSPAPAGRVQRIGDLQVVWIERISFDELAAIHAAGLCLGCARAPSCEEDGVLAEAGIFSFVPEIDYSGAILSPYRRVAAVSRPRKISEFEPGFVQELNAVVLVDAHFERDTLVQPARTLRCMGYVESAPAYLDVDLRTVRPQRGMAAEYMQMVGELEAQAPGYRFERP